VLTVFIAWVMALGIAGVFSAVIFLITKYGVIRRCNPVKWSFISVLIYFIITSSLIASKSPLFVSLRLFIADRIYILSAYYLEVYLGRY